MTNQHERKNGLECLSALQLLQFSKMLCNSYVSAIKQDSEEEDYLNIYGKTYVVIKKEDVRERMISWVEGMAFEYLFSINGFPISFSELLEELSYNIIKNKSLFVQDARSCIFSEYNDYRSEYSSLEDYVKQALGLEIEDLQSVEKIWDAEILALPTFTDQNEFLINAKPYGIDDEAIYSEIVNHLEDYDVLGDYGKEGKFDLGNVVIYKKDK
jgi:hypothetical protein